ncbi:uncharacterized protein PF11_0207-like, partial [Temnothorax curvispinosus]|uniref:Uncharacterized protein PF11_0207-like n=1 Tax=Temnothorax curvispinosus TaxID=300111 RepID=A0A6J1QE78_9HYME
MEEETVSDCSCSEKTDKEVFATPKEEKRGKGRLTKEEFRRRERSRSLSILEFMTSDNSTACELAKAKRKREENEQRTMEIFKRDNKTVRTPPGMDKAKDGAGGVGKKKEEEGVLSATKKDEEDGSLLAVLREIRNEMRDLREEMREMRERMNVLEEGRRKKEEKVEERMDKIEVRLSKIERRSENITDETTSGKMEEIVGKVAELEFGARARVKKMRPAGRVGGEIIIVEMDCWEAKDNIMKEKKKLGSKKIFIDHDLTFEDREVQRRIKERAWKEKTEGKWVKIGFRKLEIQGR